MQFRMIRDDGGRISIRPSMKSFVYGSVFFFLGLVLGIVFALGGHFAGHGWFEEYGLAVLIFVGLSGIGLWIIARCRPTVIDFDEKTIDLDGLVRIDLNRVKFLVMTSAVEKVRTGNSSVEHLTWKLQMVLDGAPAELLSEVETIAQQVETALDSRAALDSAVADDACEKLAAMRGQLEGCMLELANHADEFEVWKGARRIMEAANVPLIDYAGSKARLLPPNFTKHSLSQLLHVYSAQTPEPTQLKSRGAELSEGGGTTQVDWYGTNWTALIAVLLPCLILAGSGVYFATTDYSWVAVPFFLLVALFFCLLIKPGVGHGRGRMVFDQHELTYSRWSPIPTHVDLSEVELIQVTHRLHPSLTFFLEDRVLRARMPADVAGCIRYHLEQKLARHI